MDSVLLAVLGAALLAAGVICFQHVKRKKGNVPSLVVKGFCTLIPVAFSIGGLIKNPQTSYSFIIAALVFCLIGDIIIAIRFLWGMGAFFVAHAFFLTAFFRMAPFPVPSLFPLALAAVLLWMFFLKHIRLKGMPTLPFLFYCLILLTVAGAALFLPGTLGVQGVMFAAGAVLFAVSDLLLAKNILIRCGRLWDTVSISCYYAGIYLISMGVFLF